MLWYKNVVFKLEEFEGRSDGNKQNVILDCLFFSPNNSLKCVGLLSLSLSNSSTGGESSYTQGEWAFVQ